MATTYKLISSVTVDTATNTISFTSIPQTYTDLVIKASLRGSTTTTTFAVQVNGTTITAVRRLFGGGSGSVDGDTFNEHYINQSNQTANVFGNTDLYFPNYTTSINKTFGVDSVSEHNSTDSYRNLASNLTNITDAITSINLIRTNGNFVQYSTAYLYGISNA